MFLLLPLTSWLSLVLAGLAVSDCGLSLLQAYVLLVVSVCRMRACGSQERVCDGLYVFGLGSAL